MRLRAPHDTPAELAPLGEEALRIHESAEWSAQGQFEQAKIWRGLNVWLGVPAAVAAALAGGTGLSRTSGSQVLGLPTSVVAGVLALIAAAFSATLTTVNASRRMTQAQSSANAFLQLQTEARQFIIVDLNGMAYDDARASLKSLTDTRDELNKTADPPGRIAYRRSKRSIETGGQCYDVDSGGS